MNYTTTHAIADIVAILRKTSHFTDRTEDEFERLLEFVAGQKPLKEGEEPRNISAEELLSLKCSTKGFTQAKLAELGIPWPPPKGWRKRLLNPSLKKP